MIIIKMILMIMIITKSLCHCYKLSINQLLFKTSSDRPEMMTARLFD